MSTFFNDIETALMTRLTTMSSLPPVAWPNIEYSPNATTLYLEPNVLPADTAQASLGATGKDLTNGIFQIDVVIPAGTGRSAIPDIVADHFARGTTLSYNGTNVKVRTVSISPSRLEGSWFRMPVTINYFTYTEAR